MRDLREKYEEEVQKAEKRYLKDGELYKQQRSDALKRSTEIQRQVRGLSPFRDKRERYEDLSATEFIEALHGMRSIDLFQIAICRPGKISRHPFCKHAMGTMGIPTKLSKRHGRISVIASIAGNNKTARDKS